MFTFFKLLYRKNSFTNILWIIVGSFLLYLASQELEIFFLDHFYQNVMQCHVSDDVYYLSLNDPQKYSLKVLENEFSAYGIPIGYSLTQKGSISNSSDFDLYIFNDLMMEIPYPLSKGQWFSSSDPYEVVLGGDLAKKYPVGSTIPLFMDTTGKPYRVVGHLKSPVALMSFNTSSSQMKWDYLYSEYKSVCLIHKSNLLSDTPSLYNTNGLLFKCTDPTVLPYITQYGNPESLKEILTSSIASVRSNFMRHGILFYLFCTLFLFNIVSILLLVLMKDKDFFHICYICGLSKMKIILLECSEQLFNFSAALLLSIFLKLFISPEIFHTGIQLYFQALLFLSFLWGVLIFLICTLFTDYRLRRIRKENYGNQNNKLM